MTIAFEFVTFVLLFSDLCYLIILGFQCDIVLIIHEFIIFPVDLMHVLCMYAYTYVCVCVSQ